DSFLRGDPKPTVVALDQVASVVLEVWRSIELWRIRLPSPQPGHRSCPEAVPRLVEREHPLAKAAVLSMTLDLALLNYAKPPGGNRESAGPDRAFMIFKQPLNTLLFELFVLSKLTVLPACQPFGGADPKRPFARGEQSPNIVVGELLTGKLLPADLAHAIESKQAGFRSQPEITIGCLSKGADRTLGKAFFASPGSMRVLTDFESRVERECARAARQEYAQRCDPTWLPALRLRLVHDTKELSRTMFLGCEPRRQGGVVPSVQTTGPLRRGSPD